MNKRALLNPDSSKNIPFSKRSQSPLRKSTDSNSLDSPGKHKRSRTDLEKKSTPKNSQLEMYSSANFRLTKNAEKIMSQRPSKETIPVKYHY